MCVRIIIIIMFQFFFFFFQFPLVPVKQDKKYNVKAYDRVFFDREERCFGLYIALCAR